MREPPSQRERATVAQLFIPRPRLSPSALSSSSFMSSRQAARHGKHIDPVRSIHFSRPNQLLFKLNQAPRRHVLATLCKPPTSIHPAANQSSTLVNSLSAAPPLHPSKNFHFNSIKFNSINFDLIQFNCKAHGVVPVSRTLRPRPAAQDQRRGRRTGRVVHLAPPHLHTENIFLKKSKRQLCKFCRATRDTQRPTAKMAAVKLFFFPFIFFPDPNGANQSKQTDNEPVGRVAVCDVTRTGIFKASRICQRSDRDMVHVHVTGVAEAARFHRVPPGGLERRQVPPVGLGPLQNRLK